jgi:hypothetical protein
LSESEEALFVWCFLQRPSGLIAKLTLFSYRNRRMLASDN